MGFKQKILVPKKKKTSRDGDGSSGAEYGHQVTTTNPGEGEEMEEVTVQGPKGSLVKHEGGADLPFVILSFEGVQVVNLSPFCLRYRAIGVCEVLHY